jgi:hypothetical protein
MSVAQSVYLLATVLERADNDLLWFAILGTTSQYVAGRIGREEYEAYHELFADEVVRLNIAPIPNNDGTNGGLTGLNGRAPNPDDRSIQRTDELRFMLFRHWTLYDAMLHSGYVAGRLGIWKEKGRKRLQGLLAKMGYVLSILLVDHLHADCSHIHAKTPERLTGQHLISCHSRPVIIQTDMQILLNPMHPILRTHVTHPKTLPPIQTGGDRTGIRPRRADLPLIRPIIRIPARLAVRCRRRGRLECAAGSGERTADGGGAGRREGRRGVVWWHEDMGDE